MPKLPSLKARAVIKILEKAGFEKWRQKGGHVTFYRKKDNRCLTVSVHYGKDVPTGTLRAIISQAGLTVEEFLNLKKK